MRPVPNLVLPMLAVLLGLAACGPTASSVEQEASSATSAGRSTNTPTSTPTPTSVEATAGDDAASSPPADRANVDGVSLVYGELTERSIDIGADGRNTVAAVEGMNAFAVDLYREVAETEDGNVVLSPYSVVFALGMILAGARGATEAEMTAVLHADIAGDGWQEGVNAYDLTLDARTANSPTIWSSANKVWVKPSLPLRADYLDVLTGVYGSPLAEADFAADVEAQREAINGWVGEKTADRITELFPADAIDPDTAMVLVNAVALDAPWEFPFDPVETQDGIFTRADGSTVEVPMMRYDEFLPSGAGPGVQAVELPYGGGALSMVVIVPDDLAAFEADLTVGSLDAVLGSIQEGGIHLTMPRWSARTHLTLNDVLADLGMPTAFDAAADFSGMVDGGGLHLDRVEHEAFIEVDEAGTRAAAATGGAMLGSHGPTIAVDRPFLYVVRDRGAGTILFIGRVTDPTQGS